MLISSNNQYSHNVAGIPNKFFIQKKYNSVTKPIYIGQNISHGANLHATDSYNNISFGNKSQGLNTAFGYLLKLYRKIMPVATSSEKLSLPEMLEYIEVVKAKKGKIRGFKDLNLNTINDICVDIPVISHLKAKDLKKITNDFDSLMLQRGCPHQCSHCGMNSEKKITSMIWENFTELTDGIKTLKDRLGFNPFKTNIAQDIFDSSSTIDAVYPFADSDPMILRMKDSNGKFYSIFDAAKYYYEKTKTKFVITTAGWNKNNVTSQKAAEQFTSDTTSGGLLKSFYISIHPFHKDMQKSIEYTKEGDIEKAEYWRNRYVNNMCNVIKTTINMKEKCRYGVILEYLEHTTPENKELSLCSAEKLFKEILEKLKKEGVDISYFIRNNNLLNKENIEIRDIGPWGRASANYYSNEKRGSIGTSMMLSPDGRILLKHGDPECLSDKPLEDTGYNLNFRFKNENIGQRSTLVQVGIS